MESIPPAYVTGRYDNIIPSRFISPIDSSKIPEQVILVYASMAPGFSTTIFKFFVCQTKNWHITVGIAPWMKEVKGIRHGGGGAYLRCPVFTTVQFSLHDEGSSEYIRVCV